VVTRPAQDECVWQSMLLAIIAGPLVLGLLNVPKTLAQSPQTTIAPLPSFEVASIKPNRSGDARFFISMPPGRFTTTGTTTKFLIALAYNVHDFQVLGGPSWINSERYDINAKEDDSLVEELQKLSPDQRFDQIRLRVQSLLAVRFELRLSHETKELPVYVLVIAKNGPKLLDGRAHAGMMHMGKDQLTGQGLPIESLVQVFSRQLSRTVVDQTGLKGKYDISLHWTPDPSAATPFKAEEGNDTGAGNPALSNNSWPSIFTALQEQLGLKLEPTKSPVETIVIDHLERPSEN